MGTEIFPLIAGFFKIVLLAVILLALFVIIGTVVQARKLTDQQKKEQHIKDTVVSAITTIGIALIALLVVSAIGPVFSALF